LLVLFLYLAEWMKDPDIITDMTKLIICPHGGLTTDKKVKRLVSIFTWSYLASLYPAAQECPGNVCPPLPILSCTHFICTDSCYLSLSKTEPCAICVQKEEDHDAKVADQRPHKQAAKKEFSELLNGPQELKLAGKFFVLSAAWHKSWADWVKDAGNIAIPEPLDNKCVHTTCPLYSVLTALPFAERSCARTASFDSTRMQTIRQRKFRLFLCGRICGENCAAVTEDGL